MNPHDSRAWQDAVLDEVFMGIAASEDLVSILIFKGARILARHLPDAARQSLDIDANCSQEFLANYPDRQAQAGTLQGLLSAAIRRQFESGSPVRYQLEDLRVDPKPPKDHPRGWNAFEVRMRVADMSRASQRGIPNLGIDIAHPEALTANSTTTIRIDGHGIRAYTLHRIAGEKVRAFLSSLPEYQAKTVRSGGIIRAKDIYDLARRPAPKPIYAIYSDWIAASLTLSVAPTDNTPNRGEERLTQVPHGLPTSPPREEKLGMFRRFLRVLADWWNQI